MCQSLTADSATNKKHLNRQLDAGRTNKVVCQCIFLLLQPRFHYPRQFFTHTYKEAHRLISFNINFIRLKLSAANGKVYTYNSELIQAQR